MAAWYLCAFFDDGTALGSAANDACRVDSIAQSWAVLADADPERSAMAMQAVDEQLVRQDDRLVLLFTPPFDETNLAPGYVKGYLPGVRENGGQYTHAALWVVEALARQRRGSEAMKLFDLLNPVLHVDADAEQYRVEPYVVAADVYGKKPHLGRGGWTWYTGSAAWMYRVVVESILGLKFRGRELTVDPCLPTDWPGFKVTLRRGGTTWNISVENPCRAEERIAQMLIDGEPTADRVLQLEEDGQEHLVVVVLGDCERRGVQA